MSDRCRHCDRPKATRADHDRYRGGEGEHLCWGGMCPLMDWRESTRGGGETGDD